MKKKYLSLLAIKFIKSFAGNYVLNDKTNFALDCVILVLSKKASYRQFIIRNISLQRNVS